jgi:LPS O-antigen subunit length determinant protein (WzzB/FepE family)
MDQTENKNEVDLMDYINFLWRKKWLIIIPTLFCIITAGVVSFILPSVWEVDAIIQPSKIFIQTAQGEFQEVLVTSPQEVAGQINEETYNQVIASEMDIERNAFPQINARKLRDAELVYVSTKVENVEEGKKILSSLFSILKQSLDKKVEVEIKSIDTQIEINRNSIEQKNLDIEDNLNEIKIFKIEQDQLKQKRISEKNKIDISKKRMESIIEEMKSVKNRIEEIEKQQQRALAEQKQTGNALSLLLYSNEIQHNLRYYNTLDEKLSNEKITQENLSLSINDIKDEIRKKEAQIDILKTNVNKIKNKIDDIETEIELLKDKKARIDYAKLIKEPTSSLKPVAPNLKLNIAVAGVLGLFFFTLLAFFRESFIKNRAKK